MTQTLLLHLLNEEPIMAEVDQIPQPSDQVLICNNPRRRDGKDLDQLMPEVVTIVVPWHRVMYAEVLPSEAAEDIVSFVRE